MSGKIFVFGSINTDLVVYLEKLPVPGETVSGGRFAVFPGGKGANQAVAAARAGAQVEMFGCLGDDPFGRERLASFERTGISTRGIRIVKGISSGVASILVDAHGENSIAVAPGANLHLAAEGIEIPEASEGGLSFSLFQNEIPEEVTRTLIERTKAAGHTVLWNIAPTIKTIPRHKTLAAVDYLICNRNELSALTRTEGGEPAALARTALELGVKNLIVTLGRDGSLWVSPKGIVTQGAFPVKAVDTVGAGDCFCGVFAASLAEGADVRASLRRASAAAAISCTRQGAQDSMPDRKEIESFLRENAASPSPE